MFHISEVAAAMKKAKGESFMNDKDIENLITEAVKQESVRGTKDKEVRDLMLKYGRGEKGILVDITGSDSTNNGITSGEKKAILLMDDGPFTAKGDIPILELVPGYGSRKYMAVPVGTGKGSFDTVGPMFGGQFIFSSDARFPSDQPIHVHDRFETPEQYDLLSR